MQSCLPARATSADFCHRLERVRHERTRPEVAARSIRDGIHATIAAALAELPGLGPAHARSRSAPPRLTSPSRALSEERLAGCDVLVWWATGRMPRSRMRSSTGCSAMLAGMGLIVLRTPGHFAPLPRLMGTHCSLQWRRRRRRARAAVGDRACAHPIAAGLDDRIEFAQEEMYGERFDIPRPTAPCSSPG